VPLGEGHCPLGKQVYVHGQPYFEHRHSDSLLRFLLRAYDPERFGNRPVVELNLKDWDGDISKLTDEQFAKLYETIEKRELQRLAQQQAQLPAAGQALIETTAEEITTGTE
jgi:hypothetical protein